VDVVVEVQIEECGLSLDHERPVRRGLLREPIEHGFEFYGSDLLDRLFDVAVDHLHTHVLPEVEAVDCQAVCALQQVVLSAELAEH
jgi:hypothetical protein